MNTVFLSDEFGKFALGHVGNIFKVVHPVVENIVISLNSKDFATHFFGLGTGAVDRVSICAQVDISGVFRENETALSTPHSIISVPFEEGVGFIKL